MNAAIVQTFATRAREAALAARATPEAAEAAEATEASATMAAADAELASAENIMQEYTNTANNNDSKIAAEQSSTSWRELQLKDEHKTSNTKRQQQLG